jgi:hypothetical protein
MRKVEEVLRNLWKKKEVRPYDQDDRKDGNFNYVHQEYVADAVQALDKHYQEILSGSEEHF